MELISQQQKSWPLVTLGELFDFKGGGTPSKKEPAYWNGDIPWASVKDIKSKYLTQTIDTITEEGLRNSSANLAHPGELVLITRIEPGKPAIVGRSVAVNQDCKIVSPRENVDITWAYYLFCSLEHEFIKRSNGTTVLGIRLNDVRGISVKAPPLDVQKTVVAKIEELFSELDSGIASLKTAQQQLGIYRQSLLKHAFEGKLTEQWRRDNTDKLETPEQLLTRIQLEREARYQQQLEEWQQAVKGWEAQGKEGRKPAKPRKPEPPEHYELPTDHYLKNKPNCWGAIQAVHLCDFITKGTTPAKENLFNTQGDVPFLKVYNLTHSGLLDFSIDPTFVNKETHENFLARSKVYPNDVLMNIVGPPLGKVSIVPYSFDEWNINQAIVIYRSNVVESKYLASFLLFKKTVNFMMSQAKATAGQFNLTLEICRNLPIPVPSRLEQQEIINLLEEKLSIVDQNEKEIETALAKAELLRQSILKKAFSGQLLLNS